MSTHHGGGAGTKKKTKNKDEDGEKPKKTKHSDKHDEPEKPEAPGPGGQTPAGFDDGSAITEPLQPPKDTSGEDIQQLVKDAGIEVMAVEWVFEKITGTTLTQLVIEPITGDFSKMSADAEAWRNIGASMKAFSAVMTDNEKVLGQSWTGPAALAHKAYVDIGWKAALLAEAGIADLIGKGFDLLSDTSEKLAAKALDLLKSLIDRLLVMAAEACVPIAGWIADALTALSEILPLVNALIAIIDMITDIVEKVGDLWNSLKDMGSQLAKIKDIKSLGDAVEIGKNIAGDAKDIKGDVKDIAEDTRDIGKRAREGAEESVEAKAKNDQRAASRPRTGRISGRID